MERGYETAAYSYCVYKMFEEDATSIPPRIQQWRWFQICQDKDWEIEAASRSWQDVDESMIREIHAIIMDPAYLMRYNTERLNEIAIVILKEHCNYGKEKNNMQFYKAENDAIKTKSNFPIRPIILSKEEQERIKEIEYKNKSALNKGTLTNLGGKPFNDKKTHAQRNSDYFNIFGKRIERNIEDLGNTGKGLLKTVGASAALATGAAYTLPTATTWAGLGTNLLLVR